MKKLFTTVTLLSVLLSTQGHAELINRGGGMIYDTILNITWMQDANYAKTSGYSRFGLMQFDEANAWANSLNFGGYDDWRLPTLQDTGQPGCDLSYSRGTDCGWNSQTYNENTGEVYSELAYMFYDNLGNLASHDPVDGDYLGGEVDWGVTDTGPFLNLQNASYWTQLEYAPEHAYTAWGFDAYDGYQGANSKGNGLYAWAVRAGDVSVSQVPLPSALWLFGVSLLGLFNISRNRLNRHINILVQDYTFPAGDGGNEKVMTEYNQKKRKYDKNNQLGYALQGVENSENQRF